MGKKTKNPLELIKEVVSRVVATAESPNTATVKLNRDQAEWLRGNGVELKAGMPMDVRVTETRDGGNAFGRIRQGIQPSLTFDNTDLGLTGGDFARFRFEELAGKKTLHVESAVNPGEFRPLKGDYAASPTGVITDRLKAALSSDPVLDPPGARSIEARMARKNTLD